MVLPTLPTELILQISHYLQLGGLAALARTSSVHYGFLHRDLYLRGVASGRTYDILLLAAQKGLRKTAELCISSGAKLPLDYQGNPQPGLHYLLLKTATQNGHVDIARQLLEWDSGDKDYRPHEHTMLSFLKTPLAAAAFHGNMILARLLLEKDDIDCNLADSWYSYTPLHLAVMGGHSEMVELLLQQHNIKPDELDVNRRTPLSWAAEKGQLKTVRLLLARSDVNVESKDIAGNQPIDYAVTKGGLKVSKVVLFEDPNPETGPGSRSLLRNSALFILMHFICLRTMIAKLKVARQNHRHWWNS